MNATDIWITYYVYGDNIVVYLVHHDTCIVEIWYWISDTSDTDNWTYQDFDKIDRKEAAVSSAGSTVPFAVHLLHHGHDISGCQTQLSRTLCVKQISEINYV